MYVCMCVCVCACRKLQVFKSSVRKFQEHQALIDQAICALVKSG